MITKVTSATRPKYNQLFEDADVLLNNPETDTISGLDDYFSRIEDIVAAAGQNALNDRIRNYEKRKFLALPFSEDYFEIDANTRTIKIPSDFARNGISVQGDQVAETLYFKIDRYFDAMDLGNMVDETLILGIQWKDSVGNEHFSVSDFIDIVSHPGYVIFNWDIDSSVTANAGPISFSVRIYRLDANKQVTYSFSTLTATSFISNALNYDTNALSEGDSMNSLVLGRLTNSPAPVNTGDAVEPTIILHLPANIDLDASTSLAQLLVQAIATDGGRVSYKWKYKPLGSESTVNFGGDTNDKLYKATEDELFTEDNDYYLKSSTTGGVDSYQLLSDETDFERGTSIADWRSAHDDAVVYEKYASANANATGYYYVEINNRHNGSNNTVVEGPCLVPGPSAFTVVPSHARAANFLNSSGKCTMNIDRTSNAPAAYGDPDDFVSVWYEDEIDPSAQKGTGALYTAGGDEGVPSEARAKFDHVYIVQTKAKRNGVLSSVPDVQEFRVTADPADYKQTVGVSANSITLISPSDVQEMAVSVTNADSILADSYSYQWYKDLGARNIGNVETVSEEDEAISGATSAVLQVGETTSIGASGIGNYYYCKVTRTLNGKDTVATSESIYLGKSY